MEITKSQFTISSAVVGQCPKDNKAEFAFIGRSNVGKSSLINMLCQHKGLAKTSSTPGKTLLINHFLINDRFYFVDLPGYGYAKRSKTMQEKLARMINSYILLREQLLNLYLLIDIRHKPQAVDLDFINFLGENGVPFTIVFTKADKLSRERALSNVRSYMNTLTETWEELPPYIITSSERKEGRDELLASIAQILRVYESEATP